MDRETEQDMREHLTPCSVRRMNPFQPSLTTGSVDVCCFTPEGAGYLNPRPLPSMRSTTHLHTSHFQLTPQTVLPHPFFYSKPSHLSATMGKKSAAAADVAKKNCACGRHAMGEKEPCRFCPRVVCDSCREEYCCGPICEKCNEDREHLMQCDTCEAPVCERCIVISKGAREGNHCKNCHKAEVHGHAQAHAHANVNAESHQEGVTA